MVEVVKSFTPNRNRTWLIAGLGLLFGMLCLYWAHSSGKEGKAVYGILLLLLGLRAASWLPLRYTIGPAFYIQTFRWERRAVPLDSITYIGKPSRLWNYWAGLYTPDYSAGEKRDECVEIAYTIGGGSKRVLVGPTERGEFIAALAAAAKAAGADPDITF